MYSKRWKKKCQLRIQHPPTLSFRNEEEIKTLLDKEKLKEFVASRPTQKEMLKGVLQIEMKLDSNSKSYDDIKIFYKVKYRG